MQIKVIFDPALLHAEQPMAEVIYQLQSQRESFFPRNLSGLVPAASTPEPVSHEIYMEGLLRPPGIDSVKIEADEDGTDPILFISAAENAGKINIFVSVLDESGNLVTCGPAFYLPGSGTQWAFPILEPVASGIPVHVSIHVIDCVGGVRVDHHRLIVP